MNTSPLSPELAPAANLLESDQPKVLALVGAGISADATSLPHATWLGLLKHGVNHLVSTEFFPGKRGADLIASLETAFSPFDLVKAIEHAELVERNLMVPNPACFAQWLDSAFATFPIRPGRAAALDALRNLQQAGVLLVTTNYDSLLAEATGLQPVTWQEHDEFLKVVSRQRPGILHLHGYWKRPSSVVLGRTSYDRIVADRDFQDIFKSLWLEWSWIYVGCGDGLDDPNLGRLLAWGQRWGAGALPDYFLAKADKAHALAQRIDKPRNLVIIGYADHADLPGILTSLTPAAHCWPFVPVDGNFFLYRASNSPATLAFPSRAEYLDGRVPTLAADAEVLARLERHGWAFVLDVASVGKTTLGLRIAATPAQRDYPAYYVDLAMVDPEMVMDALTAARSLARPGALLIVDNAHHQPELARQVWEQWRDRSRGSRLLLIATRIQRVAITTPAQDLEFFECHAANPAIELRPAAADLVSILACIHGRVGAGRAAPLAAPPPSVLQEWHRDYGNALGAFCLAVLGRLNEFSRGRWELPLEAASDWVKEKWLKHLNARALENLLCLSVFGSQEFELEVADHALPHPNDTDLLLRLGLVVRRHRGKLSQHRSFRLREPGWGRLILAAHPTDGERILFEAAARYPITALLLSARLRREGSLERLSLLWRHLALNPNDLIRRIELVSLGWASNLVQTAASQGQSSLADRLWTAIERDPDNVAERAWETPLDQVAASLEKAKRQGRNTEPLWTAIERDPNKVAERALETPLNDVAAFLEEAKRQGRDTEPLWTAIERDPNKVAERAWKTPLKDAAAFLEEAKRQGRNTGPLWTAIERDPDKVAERAWETPLDKVAAFLEEAKRQGRDTEPLWTAIERDPNKVAERAWKTPLKDAAAFLEEAKRQMRNTEPLWTAIERNPDKVAERAWETPLKDAAAFLEEAKRQMRNTEPLWTAIERDPDKVAERAWETPLNDVAAFLEEAKRQGRNTEPLWTAIERNPDKLIDRVWQTALNNTAHFLAVSKQHGRECKLIWEAFEREPSRLSAVVRRSSVANLAGFLNGAPDSLVRIALSGLDSDNWSTLPDSESLAGATWLAYASERVGREDLKFAIIARLLQRAKPEDFPRQNPMSLRNIGWLLRNVPPELSGLVPRFLEVFCTNRWLGFQFTNSPCGLLALGIGFIALYQTPEICRRFKNTSLRIRVAKELSRFQQAAPEERVAILQLLGTVQLLGCSAQRGWFTGVQFQTVAKLPEDALPHRPDCKKVEMRQYNLWLGLWTLASVAGRPLPIASAVLTRTLDLWRVNLAESSIQPYSTGHWVDQSMIAWLEETSYGQESIPARAT